MPLTDTETDTGDLRAVMGEAEGIVREAGAIATSFFRRGAATSARIWSKAGGSPVTEADVTVDTFLKIRLSRLLPSAGWLSEETADDARRLERSDVWIVDPIDGTRAFLGGDPDWSIAVALLRNGRPVLGIVFAPAHDTFHAAVRGQGASLNGLPISASPRAELSGASVTGPVPLMDRLARTASGLRRLPRVPSLALRIVRIADGTIDIGLVSGQARDWDIAAADLVLSEAGGALFAPTGMPPLFNLPQPVHGELAASSLHLKAAVVAAMTRR